jgi:hypothetical protein
MSPAGMRMGHEPNGDQNGLEPSRHMPWAGPKRYESTGEDSGEHSVHEPIGMSP